MSTQIQAVSAAVVAPVGADPRRLVAAAQPTATAVAPPALTTTVAAQNLQDSLQEIARYLRQNQTGLEFRVDGDSDRVIVSIVDPEDGTVIRQIPSEEVLRIAELLSRQSRGLVDTQA